MTRQTWTTPALLLLAACTAGGIPTSSGGWRRGNDRRQLDAESARPNAVRPERRLLRRRSRPYRSARRSTSSTPIASRTRRSLISEAQSTRSQPARRSTQSATQQNGQHALGRLQQRRPPGRNVVADDYGRSRGNVSVRLLLPLRRADASRDRCAVSSRPRGLRSLFVALACAPARAIPIFAQRYHFKCGQCHSVLPELNAFGNYFRSHGYRLPLPEHGTTVFAIALPVGVRQAAGGGLARVYARRHRARQRRTSVRSRPICTIASARAAGQADCTCSSPRATTRTRRRSIAAASSNCRSRNRRVSDSTICEQYGYYGAHVGLNNMPLSSTALGRANRSEPSGNLTRGRRRRLRGLSRRGVRRQTRADRRDDVDAHARS